MSAVDRTPTRRTRMQNGNRFKLGLFGMNCSGSVPTVVPERWKAGWPETREAARLADAAGLEFLLPIARWLGYGGVTVRHGTSFETLSWASALLASTTDIVAFATVHAPLLSPVFAAKSCVTADHVGCGRFGLNVVSGWNIEEFAMFGARLLDHDYRYQYTEEWVSILKKLWSETSPFDFSGKYFELKNVGGKPRRLPVHGDRRRGRTCRRDHRVTGGHKRDRRFRERPPHVPGNAEGDQGVLSLRRSRKWR